MFFRILLCLLCIVHSSLSSVDFDPLCMVWMSSLLSFFMFYEKSVQAKLVPEFCCHLLTLKRQHACSKLPQVVKTLCHQGRKGVLFILLLVILQHCFQDESHGRKKCPTIHPNCTWWTSRLDCILSPWPSYCPSRFVTVCRHVVTALVRTVPIVHAESGLSASGHCDRPDWADLDRIPDEHCLPQKECVQWHVEGGHCDGFRSWEKSVVANRSVPHCPRQIVDHIVGVQHRVVTTAIFDQTVPSEVRIVWHQDRRLDFNMCHVVDLLLVIEQCYGLVVWNLHWPSCWRLSTGIIPACRTNSCETKRKIVSSKNCSSRAAKIVSFRELWSSTVVETSTCSNFMQQKTCETKLPSSPQKKKRCIVKVQNANSWYCIHIGLWFHGPWRQLTDVWLVHANALLKSLEAVCMLACDTAWNCRDKGVSCCWGSKAQSCRGAC